MMMEKNIKEVKAERYWQGTGRRKTSVASAMIRIGKKDGAFIVNTKDVSVYFPTADLSDIARSPLSVLEEGKSASVSVITRGGGVRGQAEAVRHAVSRALVKHDIELRQKLKQLGYLTRDPRKVERKKPGLKKARRAPQFSKR